ncbi:hypothetical protein GF376_03295 [Candidatus Peregrinibacteria bacterium]|nr:hypothetical protein [Candidatus Peregrinibacteria bacterium]
MLKKTILTLCFILIFSGNTLLAQEFYQAQPIEIYNSEKTFLEPIYTIDPALIDEVRSTENTTETPQETTPESPTERIPEQENTTETPQDAIPDRVFEINFEKKPAPQAIIPILPILLFLTVLTGSIISFSIFVFLNRPNQNYQRKKNNFITNQKFKNKTQNARQDTYLKASEEYLINKSISNKTKAELELLGTPEIRKNLNQPEKVIQQIKKELNHHL